MRTYKIFKDAEDGLFLIARETWFGWLYLNHEFKTEREAKKWLKRNRCNYVLEKGVGVYVPAIGELMG